MIAVAEYAFSWYTLGAIIVYLALAIAVLPAHSRPSSRIARAIRRPSCLVFYAWSAPLFWIPIRLSLLPGDDTTLSILALLMQLTGVVAAYLILAQPIYYSWHSW